MYRINIQNRNARSKQSARARANGLFIYTNCKQIQASHVCKWYLFAWKSTIARVQLNRNERDILEEFTSGYNYKCAKHYVLCDTLLHYF